MSIEAMKEALEVLEQINRLSIGENAIALPGEIDGAMDNLRAAIEQAEKQEPVAWMHKETGLLRREISKAADWYSNYWQPLYAAPRQWAGLTEEEIKQIADSEYEEAFIYLVEAKLKEKNT